MSGRGALLLLLCVACSPAGESAQVRSDSLSPAQRLRLDAELAEIDACGYVGCNGPFHQAIELDFGAFAMGASLPARLPSGEDTRRTCTQGQMQNYGTAQVCGFTLDGVIYVLLDGRIIRKDIDVSAPPTAGLPFGLRAGQTAEEAIVALRQYSDLPLSVRTFPTGGQYVSHDNVLKNAIDHPFLFSLLFADDHLIRIMLQDPSAPSD